MTARRRTFPVIVTSLATIAIFGSSVVPAAAARDIVVRDFEFAPKVVRVDRGEVVRWRFEDSGHDIVDATGMAYFGSGERAAGEVYKKALKIAGTWTYRCDIEPTMEPGTVKVPPDVSAAVPVGGTIDVRMAADPGVTASAVLHLQYKEPGDTAWRNHFSENATYGLYAEIPGTYRFRVRYESDLDDADRTAWSPTVTSVVS